MTDKEKLDAIRAEIHRLVDVRGYDREMANDLFAFMNSLPNEPVSNDFEMALAEMIDKAQTSVVEPWVIAAQWKDELIKLAKSEEPVSIWHSIEELHTAREYEYILVIYKDTTAPCVAGNKTQVSYWDRVDKWTYLEDVLNLFNIKRTIKDWKEPISEDLEEAAKQYAKDYLFTAAPTRSLTDHFKAGAKWDKEHLWKLADCDDLPEIDREVIVFTQPYPLEGNEYVVSFAHRPNPDGWDGKSIATGKVEHYTPKTYGKGGWNIPDIVCWLDVELPKEIEL